MTTQPQAKAKPVTIMRAESEIRGWLENTLRSYTKTVNDQLRGELRAEAIMLFWVLDNNLTWFQARDYFEDKMADLIGNEPEGDDADD